MTWETVRYWRAHWLLPVVAALVVTDCLVEEVCTTSADCDSGKTCLPTGKCGAPSVSTGECANDADCGAGLRCVDGACELEQSSAGSSAGPGAGASESHAEIGGAASGGVGPGGDGGASSVEPVLPPCPEGMVAVADVFCIDRWEASRPDATDASGGVDTSKAQSASGVMPWLVYDNDSAEAACRAAGKDLCTAAQWRLACEGLEATNYAYGDSYEPETCNGIDTFGRSSFHLEPTGAFPDCQNQWGAFDLNGNVWEHVLGGDGRTVRGGAYNCSDSVTYHRCDYIPTTWTPLALGFRCCGETT